MVAGMRAASLVLLSLLTCRPAPPSPRVSPTVTTAPEAAPRVAVRVRAGLADGPLQGRLLVLLTRDGASEPRFQVSGDDRTAQVFGMDVEGWAPGQTVELSGEVHGYPLPDLKALPPGEYTVQALLHRYETFNRADGKTVQLPMDRGEGQQWAQAPGNLLSTPQTIKIGEDRSLLNLEIEIDRQIPPLPPVVETRLLRHVEIESPRLTEFWGRPIKIGARVLLPQGWHERPDARYPLIIYHSHFARELAGWRETPADAELPPVDREGLRRECPNGHGTDCKKYGYERLVQEASHEFYKQWTGEFPRVILIQLEHANPYYDDSYAVNSENVGPYGDAITHELIPYIEAEFRGLGAWARGMYGGSTGGWEALAAQIFYPDEYNGAIGNCPDPVDFRAYVTVDIYDDDNAYFTRGQFRSSPRIGAREADGTLRSTVEQDNRYELALGTRSRSGQQFDIWEAVYSPVGEDGYPRRIFDKQTGQIDRAVAAHWREHYDLGHIVTRDWQRLAPKLRGKLWVNTGDMDNFFLERAVRLFEERVARLDPPADATFRYGHGHGHCWSGDPDRPNFESRMTYHARFIPLLVERFLRTAPEGADTTSWRY